MPPPPLKLRLLLLLPLIPSILALLLLVMLVVDKPILFADRMRCKIYYGGGAITYTSIKPDVWIGPSTETINGNYGPEYKHFQEKRDWESGLPRIGFSHLGVSYFSGPRAEAKGSSFVADRWSILSIRAEYLVAIAAGFLIWTVLLYCRARRAYRDLCRGYCPICGYDLRASPYKCPECGAVRA